ncbi:MAG TPA: AAA family ATPase [bacterium]|nr:AAA family ATPase [bacterium]
MLTQLTIRNFKRFRDAEIELGNPVVFIGPNDSGKTTALQALALWYIGLQVWTEKRAGRETPEKRPGVTINRRDLVSVPVPDANLLWRDLHVRDVRTVDGKPHTDNIRMDIIVKGITLGKPWECGFEFDYANPESFYCRPLRLSETKNPERMAVPEEASSVRVSFLPPMSGLAANETRLDPGAVNVRLGEGRTAEVLRNLCYQVYTNNGPEGWTRLSERIRELFGVRLDAPEYVKERGEVTMTYRSPTGVRLDLSSSGRGLQQTLLLLSYMFVNPKSALLLDEPDAHLEILRQRQIYQLLTDTAKEQDSQIIAASHSEVVLNEAADRDVVIAFVGRPHRIDDRGSQVLKSLREIGFEQYYEAEQTGVVLYLEGATDLAILRGFAETLTHPVTETLKRPFVHYVQNHVAAARGHFYGLKEAKRDLVGVGIYDRTDIALQVEQALRERMWRKREIENYLCQPETLMAHAEASAIETSAGSLFAAPEVERRRDAMDRCIRDLVPPIALRDRSDPWWSETKASDEFLDRLFERFYAELGLPNIMRKTDYHILARLVPRELIDPEVVEVLNLIYEVSREAHPLQADGEV